MATMKENSASDDVLDGVWSTLKLHPEYYKSFVQTQDLLIKGHGPLNYINRHFISIMAASRHSCPEIISHHSAMLQDKIMTMAAATDPAVEAWLKSGFRLADANQKYRTLDNVNRIMAHKPWMLTKNHIMDLTRMVEGEDGNQRWIITQVGQAITLIAHIHSFSSFVLGCGVMEESHDVKVQLNDPINPANVVTTSTDTFQSEVAMSTSNETASEDSYEVSKIVAKMETLGADIEEIELTELTRRFEKIEKSLAEDVVDEAIKVENPCNWPRSQTPNSLDNEDHNIETGAIVIHPERFTNELHSYQYVDFVKRQHPDIYRTLRDGEFSWGDHAYSMISSLCGDDIAKALDKKFKTIDSLTYMNIGSYTSVDTSVFRRAIQCYVQCLFGIRHDDYNYALVNEMLPRRLKKYIKTVSCYPERCTAEEYNAIMPDFRRDEKIHVCILICEARLQSELLYACRAISDWYTTSK